MQIRAACAIQAEGETVHMGKGMAGPACILSAMGYFANSHLLQTRQVLH
jgi:hypothetical protein